MNIKAVVTVIVAGLVSNVSTVRASGGVDFNLLNVTGTSYAEPQAQNGYAYFGANVYTGYNPATYGGYASSSFCSTPDMYNWYWNRGYYQNGSQNYWGRYYQPQPTVTRETWTYQRETYNNGGYTYGNYGNGGYYYGNTGYYYGRPTYRQPTYAYAAYPYYYSGVGQHTAGLADGVAHLVHGSRNGNDLEVAGGALTTAGNILNLIGDFR